MRAVDPILPELEQEAKTTRRVLERVPADKLGWKPHPKSMSLGQLALHIATTPGQVSKMLGADTIEFPARMENPSPASTAEVLKALDGSIADARAFLSKLDDPRAFAHWKVTAGGKTVMDLPRIAAVRAILLSHWYHHRGQLSVYLRILGVPVPSIYGPSADENPFAN